MVPPATGAATNNEASGATCPAVATVEMKAEADAADKRQKKKARKNSKNREMSLSKGSLSILKLKGARCARRLRKSEKKREI